MRAASIFDPPPTAPYKFGPPQGRILATKRGARLELVKRGEGGEGHTSNHYIAVKPKPRTLNNLYRSDEGHHHCGEARATPILLKFIPDMLFESFSLLVIKYFIK